MDAWKWAIFGVIVLVIGWGLYSLMSAKGELSAQVSTLSAQLSGLEKENQDLSNKVEYFKNPDNLVKELKSQTNYKLPGENLIIVTAGATSTTGTSTATSTK